MADPDLDFLALLAFFPLVISLFLGKIRGARVPRAPPLDLPLYLSSICYPFLLYRYVLLENTPLVKFIGNYIWDTSGEFSISSPVNIHDCIDDFTDIKFVSWIVLKFVGVWSKHLWVFLESLRQFSENAWERLSNLWNNKYFGKSPEIFEGVGNLCKTIKKRHHQYVYITKRTLHVSSKIWILCYSWQEQYLTSELRSLVRYYCSCHSNMLEDMNVMFSWQEQYLTCERSECVRYCSCHSNIKFISSCHHVISSMYYADNASAHASYMFCSTTRKST